MNYCLIFYLPITSGCPLVRLVENIVLGWKKLNIGTTRMTVARAIANALGLGSVETATL